VPCVSHPTTTFEKDEITNFASVLVLALDSRHTPPSTPIITPLECPTNSKLPHDSLPQKSQILLLQKHQSRRHHPNQNVPSSSLVFLTTLVVSAIAVLGTVLYRLFFHPLAGIPGPFLARCSTLWQNHHYLRGYWHDDIRVLHEKYGPVVRISRYKASFVDADASKRIYDIKIHARR
jgi:hypothetical protein